MSLFQLFLACHIITGATGLVLFWTPVLSRKGGAFHRLYGKWFSYSMLATGSFASSMAISTIIAPIENHHGIEDLALVRAIFGWMMLYLGVLTVALAWHGLGVARNRADHARNRAWLNVALQIAMTATALNCAIRGAAIGQPLMLGMATVGLIAGPMNLIYAFRARPGPRDYLIEHVKSSVGAGISVYTAFLAFGLVRAAPQLALNPLVWALPTFIGLGIIYYHRERILRGARPAQAVR